ncbi:ATP-binding protein [Lacimicrobium sp. SS2-24]|uniref:ATP-binding protein n=1 Tax=Lacimicrobium sp. SS2-24 TaxID=2005569 RepID=UPI000B4B3494|nr:ATP-binding protein [Lacimicrobium sp. SS2-24]
MSGLLRIVLIHSHLPGVVELKLDGHTNVCGTNASGKTTLQRLVPVFYGELPGKVVPRTRKKFSEFYLPANNSYLIYEYQREDGQVCQAVLTRKDADSVQYRFVEAPFDPEQVLVEVDDKQVQPMLPEQWLRQLKQLGVDYSSKLHSTSEYRSVIQNDAAIGRASGRDNTRLRQLAARYSLVSPSHRIRHMEKLVSAVHAKEGKMDTLRTMLAAIFEEDGLVQPSTTVRNTKAREWITQMRQTMRLTDLHKAFARIRAQADKLNQVEAQLQQLKPELDEDYTRLKRDKADNGEALQRLKRQLATCKEQFEQQESTLNSSISETDAERKASAKQLDYIQARYDGYLDSDMDQLQKDTQVLPLWREELEQQQEHHQLLIDQHKDMQAQLEQQKNKLFESLERVRHKNQSRIREIEDDKNKARQAHQDKEGKLRHQYETRREQQRHEFEHTLSALQQEIVAQQMQVQQPMLSDAEQENQQLAEKRLELAQRNWQQSAEQRSACERQYQQAREQTQEADNQLHDSRRLCRQAAEKLQQLEQQLSPEQGSLRAFLRDHQPGWEQKIGKVIHAPLLERKDLSPEVCEPAHGVLGISLDLSQIDPPEYAEDEVALQHRFEQAQKQLEQARERQQQDEARLQHCHQHAEQLREQLSKAQQAFGQAEQEVHYASDARQRLLQQHKTLLDERRKQAQLSLDKLQQQYDDKRQQRDDALEQLRQDFEDQLLEFRSGWQEELSVLDEQAQELESQVDKRREQNRAQIKQLEERFNQELASKDIDPAQLQKLKQDIDELKARIHRVSSRRDELREYNEFMRIDWSERRPELLEQETQLKASLQSLQQQRDNLKQQYQSDRAALLQQQHSTEQQLHQCSGLLTEIEPLIRQLSSLQFDFAADPPTGSLGDQQERIARANEGLESRSRIERQFKELLNEFEAVLGKDAGKDFLDVMEQSFAALDEHQDSREKLPILERLLSILDSRARQIIEQGETIGGDLNRFFTVFSDINRKIASQSRRLTEEVADDLSLDGIARSEVKILSTVDELNFWQPLKRFAQAYQNWRDSGDDMPQSDYLESLADVVEVLPNDASYNIESLLRLELHLNEGGSDLVIKNDRQLLESSSHGMAYLILCKFLLAFTRLLRNQAAIRIHWPIDEIGTLAYHNVEKLFEACEANHIDILGAFPNPESEVLLLFKHRYLIDKQRQELQKIEPRLSRIAERLKAGSKMEEAL